MSRTKVESEIIYHELARRLLLKQSIPEVAQAMRMKPQTVQAITRRDDFREVLEQIRKGAYRETDHRLKEDARNLEKEIRRAAVDSFDVLQELLVKARSEGTKMRVAQDMLNRAGYQQKEERAQVNIQINTTDAQVLAETLQKEKEARKRLQKDGLVTKASEFTHPTDLKRGTNTSKSANRGSSATGS